MSRVMLAFLVVGACKPDESHPPAVPEPPPVRTGDLQPAEPDPESTKPPSAVVARRMGGLQSCFEDALRRRPDLSGRVTYTLWITPAGVITDLSMDDTLGDPAFAECTRAKITAWRFATGPEDGTVTFTVVYSPAPKPPSPPRAPSARSM